MKGRCRDLWQRFKRCEEDWAGMLWIAVIATTVLGGGVVAILLFRRGIAVLG